MGTRRTTHGRVPEEPTSQEPSTRYYDLDDSRVPELGGSRPDRLFAVSGPKERVQRHTVEQMADSALVLPMLDAPVPLVVEQPVKVLKTLDNSLPDVEQVIEVPKTILHQLLQRAVPRELQLVEQLLVPSFHQCTRMADFRDDGRRWCLLTGPEPRRFSWWLVETDHEQGTTPAGDHRQPRAVFKNWAWLRISLRPLVSGSHLFC